ncbi:hypothetical protein BDK51DRAFT_52366 [Blyttiomyces helicus]|uniref:Uncharacterized protein n=1 Tax=Blyttiomyces helicus TaxID=388810 RepID=A0A4P9WG04_9FUNG|nr:hypothetical protein BDK51DRAFT_52366 [Blyttiomyces helicus]|eukprot:RKO91604.1 hypothetical protein BDK51DRAFT_52366 [Blyttiomyces helicus]
MEHIRKWAPSLALGLTRAGFMVKAPDIFLRLRHAGGSGEGLGSVRAFASGSATQATSDGNFDRTLPCPGKLLAAGSEHLRGLSIFGTFFALPRAAYFHYLHVDDEAADADRPGRRRPTKGGDSHAQVNSPSRADTCRLVGRLARTAVRQSAAGSTIQISASVVESLWESARRQTLQPSYETYRKESSRRLLQGSDSNATPLTAWIMGFSSAGLATDWADHSPDLAAAQREASTASLSVSGAPFLVGASELEYGNDPWAVIQCLQRGGGTDAGERRKDRPRAWWRSSRGLFSAYAGRALGYIVEEIPPMSQLKFDDIELSFFDRRRKKLVRTRVHYANWRQGAETGLCSRAQLG